MKLPQSRKDFLHPWYLFIATFLSLFLILFLANTSIRLTAALLAIGLFLRAGLKVSSLLKVLFYSLVFSLMFLLLNLIYPSERFENGEMITFMGQSFYLKVLLNASDNFLKIFLLTVVSISSTSVILYTKMILFLIQRKYLSVNFGYPLLISLNSIDLFKSEFQRIKLSMKLRKIPKHERIFVLFPLLVFAIRHSQRGALSLVTRGLNEEKHFYYNYGLAKEDHKRFIVYGIFFALSVAIAFLI